MVPDSKIYVANMEPAWGRQDPGESHVGHMNLAIWGVILTQCIKYESCLCMVLNVTINVSVSRYL